MLSVLTFLGTLYNVAHFSLYRVSIKLVIVNLESVKAHMHFRLFGSGRFSTKWPTLRHVNHLKENGVAAASRLLYQDLINNFFPSIGCVAQRCPTYNLDPRNWCEI